MPWRSPAVPVDPALSPGRPTLGELRRLEQPGRQRDGVRVVRGGDVRDREPVCRARIDDPIYQT